MQLLFSTLSVIMNATSLVVLEDIVRGCMKRNPSEAQASLLVIGVVVALGATSLILLLFVEKIDGILIVSARSLLYQKLSFSILGSWVSDCNWGRNFVRNILAWTAAALDQSHRSPYWWNLWICDVVYLGVGKHVRHSDSAIGVSKVERFSRVVSALLRKKCQLY